MSQVCTVRNFEHSSEMFTIWEPAEMSELLILVNDLTTGKVFYVMIKFESCKKVKKVIVCCLKTKDFTDNSDCTGKHPG